jgi:uracil-DNA glycosylase
MEYRFPFGEVLKPLVQEDRTPKKVFVLGVYASAVHARWKCNGQIVCQALAVASEPRIFWDGDPEEAKAIIGKIQMPAELGYLEPAGRQLNGPSAKVLEENILEPLGVTRKEAWLCDLLPETRLNPSQQKALKEKYEPLMVQYGLNPVTIPKRPSVFCSEARSREILEEIEQSQAELLVLLGDLPIGQFLNRMADVPYSTLQEFVDLYGYGNPAPVMLGGRKIEVLPLAHPRQIGALGAHSEKWNKMHRDWEKSVAAGK